MKIDMGKDVFYTIRTAIGYPPELAWNKIRDANFCKLVQITKKLIILGGLKLKLGFSNYELSADT